MRATNVGENWTCPYCGHAQVLARTRRDHVEERLGVEGTKNDTVYSIGYLSIVCANSSCCELNLTVQLLENFKDAHGNNMALPVREWMLLPLSSAKPQPDFIPQAIREDYYEACSIRDL